jgi:hypothetical protein
VNAEAVPVGLLMVLPVISAICLGLMLRVGQAGGRWQLCLVLLVVFGGHWGYLFTRVPWPTP